MHSYTEKVSRLQGNFCQHRGDEFRFRIERPACDEEVTAVSLEIFRNIGYLNDDNYGKHPFWDWASENYKQVIVAVGNHELYKYYDLANMPHGLVCSIRDNVKCYYDAVVRIENVDFIISTLWAKIPLEEAYITERGVSDFHRILYNGELLTWDNFNREHDKCFCFIQDEVANSTAEHIIAVTHHVPSFQLASPDFAGSKINGAFTVELEQYMENKTLYWRKT